MSRTVTVTPLLDIGGGNDSAVAAVHRITVLRQRANVADIDTARQVLVLLGLDEKRVDDRIHFALTGEVLVEG